MRDKSEGRGDQIRVWRSDYFLCDPEGGQEDGLGPRLLKRTKTRLILSTNICDLSLLLIYFVCFFINISD